MIYKHEKHEIEIYSDFETLPILRFQKFNKYQLKASDVGSEFSDFQQRVVKISQYIQKDLKDSALKELENMTLTVFNGFHEISPRSKAFAILVKRIDEEEFQDISAEGLQKCLEALDAINFPYAEVLRLITDVKKKLDTQLSVYFPKQFKRGGDKETALLRVKRANLMLDNITDPGEQKEIEIFELERLILERNPPNIWNTYLPENMELFLESEFNKFLLSVCENSNLDIDKLTVKTFYSKVEQIKDKNK